MSTATFHLHPSPIGDILLVARPHALVRAEVLHRPAEHALAELTPLLGTVPVPGDVGPAPAQLDEYFAGRRREFDVALEWELARGFAVRALQAVCTIAYGEVASYGEVAVLAGTPGAARAVGTACRTTPFSVIVPVHRVVRADGSIGEYGGHPDIKRYLLELEDANADAARAATG